MALNSKLKVLGFRTECKDVLKRKEFPWVI
jgi:hypothetical protein